MRALFVFILVSAVAARTPPVGGAPKPPKRERARMRVRTPPLERLRGGEVPNFPSTEALTATVSFLTMATGAAAYATPARMLEWMGASPVDSVDESAVAYTRHLAACIMAIGTGLAAGAGKTYMYMAADLETGAASYTAAAPVVLYAGTPILPRRHSRPLTQVFQARSAAIQGFQTQTLT